jgi:hypothetical protein
MTLFSGLNPWIAMWSEPRTTIRVIVHNHSSYGIYYLAAMYALQSFFFYANWWSLGLIPHFQSILALAVAISPLLGTIWLYFTGGVYYLIGHALKGEASGRTLRAAIAWSTLPFTVSLLMWLSLFILEGSYVFIHEFMGPSSVFVNAILIIVSIWSFVLLVQSIREVQQFSLGRSILNVLLAYVFSFLFIIVFSTFLRYLYV